MRPAHLRRLEIVDEQLQQHEVRIQRQHLIEDLEVLRHVVPRDAEVQYFVVPAERVFDQVRDRVVLVGVDVGPFVGLGEHDDARRLLAELGIHYPAAFAIDSTPVRLYQVRSMPTTIFVTSKGKILDTANGMLVESQMRGKIERLIGNS